MTSKPTATVVIPTYNRAAMLGELLDLLDPLVASGDVAVVVVDDGSTDDTPQVIAQHAGVRCVRQANAGAAAARNTGLAHVEGAVVAFLDDDCRPGPDWPHPLVDALSRADPDVAGIGGPVRAHGDSVLDRFIELERQVSHGAPIEGGVDFLITANAAFRVEALRDVGGFDIGFQRAAGEDVDLSWRLRKAGRRLLVIDDGAVDHVNRATLKGILRTYRAHGEGRAALRRMHPDDSLVGAGRRATRPAAFADRWRTYRSGGCDRRTALGFTVLRVAGLAAYLFGLVRAGRRS